MPGLLRSTTFADTSADAVIPLLILAILQAKPEHLISNLNYISRFRNPAKLHGESEYYISSIVRAVPANQFILIQLDDSRQVHRESGPTVFNNKPGRF